ncbi:MAG: DMT family transporter [Zavarzinella sp.]
MTNGKHISPTDQRAINRGRWCILSAAILWSCSGLLTRMLQLPTALHLNEPALTSIQIAVFRAFFAGIFFVPLLVRVRNWNFRPLMAPMVCCFALMNATYVTAMALGSSANAILLQNSSPFFVFLYVVLVMKEPADRRSLYALLVGMLGIVIIVVGGSSLAGSRWDILLLGLASGVTYAGIILFLRALRDQPAEWLTCINHLGSAFFLSLAIFILHGGSYFLEWITTPTWQQLLFLLFFGTIQMGLPYWLFARGLRTVNPQEAGAITLLEPLLNPLWAYLISPETDTPTYFTLIGGMLILSALAYRYSVPGLLSQKVRSRRATSTNNQTIK